MVLTIKLWGELIFLKCLYINQSMKSTSDTGKLKIQRLKCKNTINAKQKGKRNGASRYLKKILNNSLCLRSREDYISIPN